MKRLWPGVLMILILSAPPRARPQTPFQPVSFDLRKTIRFDHPKEQVCPLFEPEWRRLWIDWWKPEVLFSPAGDTREGSVLRIPTPHGDGAAILTYVSRHDPGAMEILYSIIYHDVEIEKKQIACAADPDGGTVAEIRTVIMGLNEYGNRAVRQHVEAGNVEAGIEEYRKAIDKYLRDKNLKH